MIELILLSVFLAAFVGTVTGFGTSTILVPILALFFSLPEVLLFVAIVHLFSDAWKMLLFKSSVNWKIILWFGVPGVVFSAWGARLVIDFPETLLARVLGVVLILFAASSLLKPQWKLPARFDTTVIGGAASGLLAGVLGVGGAVRGAFLDAFRLPKETYLFTIGSIAILVDSSRVVTYWLSGVRFLQIDYRLLILSIPLSLIAALLARKVVRRSTQDRFRQIVAIGLLLIGLKLIWW